VEAGGTTPDGLAAQDRSWVFTYADWDIDEEETVPNIPSPAARVNPDPTITDNSYLLYSVRDPRGHETKFTYHGEKPQAQKDNAGKLKCREDRAAATTIYSYDLATDTTTVDLPAERQTRTASTRKARCLSRERTLTAVAGASLRRPVSEPSTFPVPEKISGSSRHQMPANTGLRSATSVGRPPQVRFQSPATQTHNPTDDAERPAIAGLS
jgi:hypothetical protein